MTLKQYLQGLSFSKDKAIKRHAKGLLMALEKPELNDIIISTYNANEISIRDEFEISLTNFLENRL